jgi:hypothetical protein
MHIAFAANGSNIMKDTLKKMSIDVEILNMKRKIGPFTNYFVSMFLFYWSIIFSFYLKYMLSGLLYMVHTIYSF